MLKGELVNENCREEPVCLKYSEGLVAVNVGARPTVLKGELLNRVLMVTSTCPFDWGCAGDE